MPLTEHFSFDNRIFKNIAVKLVFLSCIVCLELRIKTVFTLERVNPNQSKLPSEMLVYKRCHLCSEYWSRRSVQCVSAYPWHCKCTWLSCSTGKLHWTWVRSKRMRSRSKTMKPIKFTVTLVMWAVYSLRGVFPSIYPRIWLLRGKLGKELKSGWPHFRNKSFLLCWKSNLVREWMISSGNERRTLVDDD